MEENPGPRLYTGRFVLYTPIFGACIKICLLLSEVVCSETVVSSRRHISERKFPGFDRPMQLLGGEVDRF